MYDIELRHVVKNYGKVTAVDDFSLEVERGSFTTLLGPSGCGKTTALRLIAGFLDPDAGDILIDGKSQKGVPPEKRGIGIVFQDYALFPHMKARDNLAYGLKVRKVPKSERERQVEETAESLGLGALLDRYPHELSGGQQQRLALGRVLIIRPKILLMDEPLSNLDAKLRFRVRAELKEIQAKRGITTLYVTHDQEEALSLSNEIALMRDGKIVQRGAPEEVYNNPSSEFSADFTGPANIIIYNGTKYAVRPEWVQIEPNVRTQVTEHSVLSFQAAVASSEYLGRCTRLRLEPLAGSGVQTERPLMADIPAGARYPNGSTVSIAIIRVKSL
jgi:ABC-type Fe3+/spermidine/putrescine transport system ATPase subunit